MAEPGPLSHPVNRPQCLVFVAYETLGLPCIESEKGTLVLIDHDSTKGEEELGEVLQSLLL